MHPCQGLLVHQAQAAGATALPLVWHPHAIPAGAGSCLRRLPRSHPISVKRHAFRLGPSQALPLLEPCGTRLAHSLNAKPFTKRDATHSAACLRPGASCLCMCAARSVKTAGRVRPARRQPSDLHPPGLFAEALLTNPTPCARRPVAPRVGAATMAVNFQSCSFKLAPRTPDTGPHTSARSTGRTPQPPGRALRLSEKSPSAWPPQRQCACCIKFH